MKKIYVLGIVGVLLAIGCSCPTIKQRQTRTTLNLICEFREVEGSASPQKVCWEPAKGETVQDNQVTETLICEERSLEGNPNVTKVCWRAAKLICENRMVTGSHIPKRVCETADEKKYRELQDQIELERIQRNAAP